VHGLPRVGGRETRGRLPCAVGAGREHDSLRSVSPAGSDPCLLGPGRAVHKDGATYALLSAVAPEPPQTLGACRRWNLGRKAPDSNRNRWLSGHFPLLAGLPSVHHSSRGFATNDPGGALARALPTRARRVRERKLREASIRGSEKRLQLLNLLPLRPRPRRVRIEASALECARGKLKRRRDVARAPATTTSCSTSKLSCESRVATARRPRRAGVRTSAFSSPVRTRAPWKDR